MKRVLAALAAAAVLAATSAGAQGLGIYDPDLAWPLCGRIADDPPMGWAPGMDCPPERHGDPAFHDGPISSSFGPRQLPSEMFRYDFHRGIDLPADIGTPLFAVADGEVRKAGPDPSFDDPVLEIRHFRPGFASCGDGGGCYSSMYLHVSAWTVMPGNLVTKGQYIGETGESSSGFTHLHFEIRDAPPTDASSSWQKDCVHPLGALPYPDDDAANLELAIDSVDVSDPMNPVVTATVTAPMSIELDLETVEVEMYERLPGGDLPLSYDPGFHLDAADPGDFQAGLFNGMRIRPIHYNDESPAYQATFEFLALEGTADAQALCIRVRAVDARGAATEWQTFNCPDHSCPSLPREDCRTADRSGLQLKKKNGLLDRLKWVMKGGEATTLADFGDPVAGDDGTTWSWCLWAGELPEELFLGADLSTGGLCGGKPCWRAVSTKGFKMKDKSGTPGGVTSASLLAGDVGRMRLKVLGRGTKLDDAALPAWLPLRAQLIADDGVAPLCWQASWAEAVRNDVGLLKAK